MRTHTVGARPARRLLLFTVCVVILAGLVSGVFGWCWTQAASLLELHGPMRLPATDAARAMWHLLLHGRWSEPASAFPTPVERAAAPEAWAYCAVAVCLLVLVGWGGWRLHRRLRAWRAGSPLGKGQRTVARHAVDRGWVRQRTWALPADMRRLWVPGPEPGRPYLGVIGRAPARTLAAEPEIHPMLIAPQRSGKTTGFIIPWLLDHDGPALVLSTKRHDVYKVTAPLRRGLGRVWVYDPFGDEQSSGFSPLVPARTWSGAIRAGEALASAAHPDQANAANEFWDKEAASLIAPLLHAAVIAKESMSELVRWLDARDFTGAITTLKAAGAHAAADQLEGVSRRDERNRETTVMSALNLLRAYRYPQVAACASGDLTPEKFLDGANTIYVVVAGHDQEPLRPVILALVSAMYEAAIVKARRHGALNPRLLILLDETANIAPVRNLATWLSQCADHGITIATAWQSIAQIDQRYGRAARDSICAASTAQVFIPPLAEPTSAGYLTELLGEEPVANASGGTSRQSLSVGHQKAGPAPWLRQIGRGRAMLVYRDLPPAIVRAPGWFEDPRFARYAQLLAQRNIAGLHPSAAPAGMPARTK